MKQFWGDVTISGEYSIVTFVTRVTVFVMATLM